MYDYAMELRLVESNPARNAKLPLQSRKKDDGEDKVIPIAQREQLLAQLRQLEALLGADGEGA